MATFLPTSTSRMAASVGLPWPVQTLVPFPSKITIISDELSFGKSTVQIHTDTEYQSTLLAIALHYACPLL